MIGPHGGLQDLRKSASQHLREVNVSQGNVVKTLLHEKDAVAKQEQLLKVIFAIGS